MKKFSTSGMTAAAVLIVALVGGAAGGAMVLGGGADPVAAPRPVQMGLKVADEATVAPSPEATPEPTMAPASTPVPVASPAASEEEPVTSPKTETAKEAADRAERAAQRAESAADKVEASTAPAPAPSSPAPKVTPVPPPTVAECAAGEVRFVGREDEQVCEGGRWVSAAPNRHCKFGDGTVVESGSTTKRTSGGMEFTYRCEDSKLTLIDDGKA